jgi:hypothetical protein
MLIIIIIKSLKIYPQDAVRHQTQHSLNKSVFSKLNFFLEILSSYRRKQSYVSLKLGQIFKTNVYRWAIPNDKTCT